MVLIVERNVGGHRLSYVRVLLDYAVARGDEVHVILPAREADRPEVALHLPKSSPICWVKEPLDTLGAIEKLSRKFCADLVVVPDGDNLLLEVARGWRGSGRLSVLVMRERVQPRASRLLTSALQGARVGLIRVATSHPRVVVRVLKSSTWTGAPGRRFVADPIAVRPGPTLDIERPYSLREDLYWFGVLGAISERKNLGLVIDALLDSGLDRFGLLIAGRMNDLARRELEVRLGELRVRGTHFEVVDRLLSDEELDSAVADVDCVVLAHGNEGPSGLLGKALLTGTRVLASGAQSLKAEAALHPANVHWVPLELEALRSEMARVVEMPRPTSVEIFDSNFASILLDLGRPR